MVQAVDVPGAKGPEPITKVIAGDINGDGYKDIVIFHSLSFGEIERGDQILGFLFPRRYFWLWYAFGSADGLSPARRDTAFQNSTDLVHSENWDDQYRVENSGELFGGGQFHHRQNQRRLNAIDHHCTAWRNHSVGRSASQLVARAWPPAHRFWQQSSHWICFSRRHHRQRHCRRNIQRNGNTNFGYFPNQIIARKPFRLHRY